MNKHTLWSIIGIALILGLMIAARSGCFTIVPASSGGGAQVGGASSDSSGSGSSQGASALHPDTVLKITYLPAYLHDTLFQEDSAKRLALESSYDSLRRLLHRDSIYTLDTNGIRHYGPDDSSYFYIHVAWNELSDAWQDVTCATFRPPVKQPVDPKFPPIEFGGLDVLKPLEWGGLIGAVVTTVVFAILHVHF